MAADPGSAVQSPLNARQVLRGLAWDVGLPVAASYVLHLLGSATSPRC